MARIGTVFPPNFFEDTKDGSLHVRLSEDELMSAAFPSHGDRWRQIVFGAARRAAKGRYSHLIALIVMEELLEALAAVDGFTINEKMRDKFSQYQKCKALALAPGTEGEGRTAAKHALRVLTTVLEEAI
jgi:DNA-binding helix-hairpin-helix protein with protein kinase domain